MIYNITRIASLLMIVMIVNISLAAKLPVSSLLKQRGIPINHVKLTAMLESNGIAPGEPAFLNVTIRNDGHDPQNYIDSDLLDNSNIIVMDLSGNILNPSEQQGLNSYIMYKLMPKQEITKIYELSKLYDLSKIGKYKIIATQIMRSPDFKNILTIVSNSADLTVTSNLSKDFRLNSFLNTHISLPNQPINIKLTLKNITKHNISIIKSEIWNNIYLFIDYRGDQIQLIKQKAIDIKQELITLHSNET